MATEIQRFLKKRFHSSMPLISKPAAASKLKSGSKMSKLLKVFEELKVKDRRNEVYLAE